MKQKTFRENALDVLKQVLLLVAVVLALMMFVPWISGGTTEFNKDTDRALCRVTSDC